MTKNTKDDLEQRPPEETDEPTFRPPRGISPTQSHGTRVSFIIVCSSCGEKDTLPFVPRTRGELLCRRCAEEIFGPNWAHGRPVDEPVEYAFSCAQCGRKGYVRFEPREDRQLLCGPCMRGEEHPMKDRLSQMKKVK